MSFHKSSVLVITSFILVLISLVVLLFVKYNPLQKEISSSLISKDQTIDKFCLADNCFSKVDNIWLINQTVPADPDQIKNFITKLANINLNTIISNNPDNFSSLGISNDISIPFTIGDINYLLSSNLINLSHNLIKPTDQDVVYKISFLGDPTDLVSVDFWQVKYLQNIPQYQIISLDITSQNQSKTHHKDEKNWPSEEIISSIAYLKAIKFIGKTKPDTTKEYQLITKLEDNSQSVLTFGLSNDKTYWATVDQAFYYQIDKSDFNKLTSILK